MRDLIFLDSRDIIDVVERNQPIAWWSLAHILKRRHLAIVLTFTNVIESIPRVSDVEIAVDFVRKLERIPHIFAPHTDVGSLEFVEAVDAFREGRTPVHILPRSSTWPDYLSRSSPGPPLESAFLRQLRKMTLSTHIRTILTDGGGLDFHPKFRERIQATLDQNRQMLGSKRARKEVIADLVSSQLKSQRLGVADLAEFATWVYRDPSRCPGWRLMQEAFQEFRVNVSAAIQPGDLPDLTHLYLIPYVRAATLDRKWLDCVQRVERKLRDQGMELSYPVFKDARELLDAI